MQKWEYLFLHIENGGGTGKVRVVNGEELPNWKKGVGYVKYIQQLGEEGWELVTSNHVSTGVATIGGYGGGGGNISQIRMDFKRPRIDS